MQHKKSGAKTTMGQTERFTGAVFLDPIAEATDVSRLQASSVHFTPGARTAWHRHPRGQTLYIMEGVGLAQARGEAIEVLRPDDRLFFAPGEEHWHGASATRFMTHIAMSDVDEQGNTATWGPHVTDAEYAAAPPIDGTS